MSNNDGFKPLKLAVHFEFNDKKGMEVHELLNYYRMLKKVTWRELVLESLADYIELENQAIADLTREYIKVMPKGIGRPRTRVVSVSERRQKSLRIKQQWEDRKEKQAYLDTIQ